MSKKNLPPKPKSTYFPINVLYQSFSESYNEPEPNEKWARASSSTTHDITGAEAVLGFSSASDLYNRDNIIGDFNCLCANPVSVGQDVYVLTAIWSTGDSFGSDDGSHIDFLQAFTSLEKAIRAQQQIRAHYDVSQNMGRSYGANVDQLEKSIKLLAQDIPLIDKPERKPRNAKFIENKKNNKVFDVTDFDTYTAYFQNDNDEIETVSVSWTGYFEHLDSVEVEKFKLSSPKLFNENPVSLSKKKKPSK